MVKSKEKLLLLGEDDKILIENCEGELNTHLGKIKCKNLKVGKSIKTHLGKELVVVKPTVIDKIEKLVQRTAQVILPKDVALILAYTGIFPDSKIIDAGTGSGYCAIFMANFVPLGKVITYEINPKFYKKAKENIKSCGLKNIRIKNKDVRKGFDEKNVDMVVLDMQEVKKVIKHAWKALKPGGWLVIYSPTVDEMMDVCKELEKYKKADFRIVENIVREWQYEKTLRPKTKGLLHTGFLIFTRKLK